MIALYAFVKATENHTYDIGWRCDCGATVFKSISLVSGQYSTMCPECLSKLRLKQGDALQRFLKRDKETGMPESSLKALRDGKPFKNNTSGVRGVSWHKMYKKWEAYIHQDGKTVVLGYFDTIEAAKAVRETAVEQRYMLRDKGE